MKILKKLFSAIASFFGGIVIFAFVNNTIYQFVQRIPEMDSTVANFNIICCIALGLFAAYLWTKD